MRGLVCSFSAFSRFAGVLLGPATTCTSGDKLRDALRLCAFRESEAEDLARVSDVDLGSTRWNRLLGKFRMFIPCLSLPNTDDILKRDICSELALVDTRAAIRAFLLCRQGLADALGKTRRYFLFARVWKRRERVQESRMCGCRV